MPPIHRIPRLLLLRSGMDALCLRRRSFRRDARSCIDTLQPPLRVHGTEHIPAAGPAVIVMNHYCRPGFAVWWLAMGIAASLPMESRWIIASEWTAPGKWYEPLKETASRFVSKRLARVYDFWRMPPMPPRPGDVEARARAVRAILGSLDSLQEPVLCIAPEGADMPGGRLARPPSGVGRFLMLLAGKGLPFIPVGGWEDEQGTLCIHFGAPFEPHLPPSFTSDEKDRHAADQVMRELASLLPDHLRGEFA